MSTNKYGQETGEPLKGDEIRARLVTRRQEIVDALAQLTPLQQELTQVELALDAWINGPQRASEENKRKELLATRAKQEAQAELHISDTHGDKKQ